MPSVKRTCGVCLMQIIVKLIVCVLLLTPVLSFGQSGTTGISRERSRSSYDPGYRQNTQAQQQSGFCSALNKINPTDKDYGQLIDEARIAVIEQTVEDFYWWSCLVLCVLLVLALLYIIWLWKERELRLIISADIVAQLYNSHVASRAKALESIEMHNKLARRYNAKCEEMARAKLEAEQNEEKMNRKDETKLVQDMNSDSDGDGDVQQPSAQEDNRPQLPAQKSSKTKESTSSPSMTFQDLEALIKTLQAQVAAKDQKISNLRTQINRAHTSLAEEREGKTARQHDC